MKRFFKNTLSTILALFIFFFFTIIIIVFSISSLYDDDDIKVDRNSILKIHLNGIIVERNSDNPFESIDPLSGSVKEGLELKEILDNIEKAKNHEDIKGIYLKLSLMNAGFSQIEEIRDKLEEFKLSGKFIYAYSETFSQSGYYLASVADKVFLNPEGNLQLTGISAGVMFYKDFLEKIGVQAQIIRPANNKFKSAVEPFLYTEMSDENRRQLEALYTSLTDKMISDISKSRKISVNDIHEAINKLKLGSAIKCKSLSFIDEIYYEDQVINKIEEEVEGHKFIDYSDFANVKSKINDISDNKIAIIYATGGINIGKGNVNSIGSETTVKAIQKAKNDENIKAIVLRVNSPGGSALASDIIWRELELAKKEKPIVVSMGDYAASGGYYISCHANKIFANSNTITGSIGVFGIIPNTQDLLNNKLGIYIDTVNTHKYSDIGSGSRELTEYEDSIITISVDDIYSTFLSRVAEGRNMLKKDVDMIAQGRVWSGNQALEKGLIDEIGGLEDAIVSAAKLAKIKNYRIITLPEEEDVLEQIIENLTQTQIIQVTDFLGVTKDMLNKSKFLFSKDRIQARMPFIIHTN